MPQLVPFQFVDSIITLIVALGFVIWFLSVVVLHYSLDYLYQDYLLLPYNVSLFFSG